MNRHYPSQHDMQGADKLERVMRDVYDRIYALHTVTVEQSKTVQRQLGGVTAQITQAQEQASLVASGAAPSSVPDSFLNKAALRAVTTITADTTLTMADSVVLCDATSGAITVTLPVAADNIGRVYDIKKIDTSAYTVTIDPDGTEEIEGDTTAELGFFGECLTIISDGTAWWII